MHGWMSTGACPFLVLSAAGVGPLWDETAKPAESIKESCKHFIVNTEVWPPNNFTEDFGLTH